MRNDDLALPDEKTGLSESQDVLPATSFLAIAVADDSNWGKCL